MFPLTLTDMLAMVPARYCFGIPFLLEEGFVPRNVLDAEILDVKEVVLVSCLADALRGEPMVRDMSGANWTTGERDGDRRR